MRNSSWLERPSRHFENIPFLVSTKERLLVSGKVKSGSAKTHRDENLPRHPRQFFRRSPRFLPLSLFLLDPFLFYRARISKRVCFQTRGVAVASGGSGQDGRARIVFPRLCIFTSHSFPRALTSIACPFSIHVHYEITGSLYEIHPVPLLSRARYARAANPPFDVLRFSFVFPFSAFEPCVSLWK